MGKYKKEIRHCTRCNKPFSAYPENDEKLCANCKEADYEKMLKLNGHALKRRLVRSVGDPFMELSAIPNALKRHSEGQYRLHSKNVPWLRQSVRDYLCRALFLRIT